MITRTRFGPASFYRRALSLAIPVMLQLLLQNLVSLIDNFMVAGLGNIKMSGVNVANQLIFVLFVALMTLMSAGGIFMSQFNGTKNAEGMQQAFRFKLFTSLTLVGVAGVLVLFIPEHLLGILVNTNRERDPIIAEGRSYLSLIVWTFVPLAISHSIGSSLREIGRVKPPLVITVAATLVNTFFNWVLIYGNLGAPRMEVKGAAIATIIARSVEMIIFLVYIRQAKPLFFVQLRRLFAVNFSLFVRILSKSGFIFLSEMTWVMTETIMTAVYNGRGGSEIISGMAAGWAIANLFFLVFNGIHTSIGVIVGGTLGRNDLDTAQTEARWLKTGSFFLGATVATLQALSIMLIPIVFGNLTEDARAVTRHMLLVIACYMPVWTYLNAQFANARAGGDAIMGVWVDVTVNLFLFLPALFLLAALTDLGPITIFAIIKTTDIVKVLIASWQLRTGRWIRNLTHDHEPEAIA